MDERDALRDLGTAIRRWADDGVGVVRVLDRRGFGTVEPGQLLAGTVGGEVAGLLLRGAVDTVAVPLTASAASAPATASTDVAEEAAVAAGLGCAGHAQLLAHPLPGDLAAALGEALEAGHPVALASTVDGDRRLVVSWTPGEARHGTLGTAEADDEACRAADRLLRRGATATERLIAADVDLLLDLWVPVPTVLVVGSGAVGDALVAQAGVLGWHARVVTALADARDAVGAFSHADVLVLLDHSPDFDILLIDGLEHGRGFLGALGSRSTQAARGERLRAAGLTDDDLAALHAPVGLDLGARSPAETAVSVVAEVIASRSGRGASPLVATAGRIGG